MARLLKIKANIYCPVQLTRFFCWLNAYSGIACAQNITLIRFQMYNSIIGYMQTILHLNILLEHN